MHRFTGRTAFAVAALASAAACASQGGPSATSATSAASPSAAGSSASSGIPAHAWVSRVTALGTSGTQLYGSIRLEPTGKPDEFRVTGDLRGAKLGNQIPWSVSSGQCGETSSGEIGDRVAYRLFVAAADGTARINATMKLSVTDGMTYHVNFYAAPTDRERVVSCGPLTAG